MKTNIINRSLFYVMLLGIISVAFGYLYSDHSASVQAKMADDVVMVAKTAVIPQEQWQDVLQVPLAMYRYYPLAVGNEWKYVGRQETINEGKNIQGPSDFLEVVKSIKQNSDIFIVSIERCRGQNNVMSPGYCNEYKMYVMGNKLCDDIDCKEVFLEFPLTTHKPMDSESYRERIVMGIDDNRYVWYIGDKISTTVFGKKKNNCFSVEYFTLPDEERNIFCPGIGFVKKYYEHRGSLDIINERLISVTRAN